MRKPNDKAGKGNLFVTEFKHYLTGKVMKASDYGYRAWPFGRKKT
jgi:hypothetical protein